MEMTLIKEAARQRHLRKRSTASYHAFGLFEPEVKLIAVWWQTDLRAKRSKKSVLR
jgi:hypothetical protein